MPAVMEKVQELQALFRDEFGVEVKVDITVHPTRNSAEITRKQANDIAQQVASEIDPDDICDYYTVFGPSHWVSLTTFATGLDFAAFYRSP